MAQRGLLRRRRGAVLLAVAAAAAGCCFIAPKKIAPTVAGAWLAPWLAGAAYAEAPATTTSTPSIEDMLMDFINKATGGAFLLYGVFAILKFVLAAVGGLFVVREIDQQSFKPEADFRFNADDIDDASLAEQVNGWSAGAQLRKAARRKRFAVLWQRILDDVVLTDVERSKIEDAVQKYMQKEMEGEGWERERGDEGGKRWEGRGKGVKGEGDAGRRRLRRVEEGREGEREHSHISTVAQEKERQEEFSTARSEWLSSLFSNSWFGTFSNRSRVTGSLDPGSKRS
eukprot:Skav203141  [mRNA]  locus=scaffold2782:31061:33242:+ [translate_table: standard]